MKQNTNDIIKKIDEKIKYPFSFNINYYMDPLSKEILNWIREANIFPDRSHHQKIILYSPWTLSSYMFPNISYESIKIITKLLVFKVIFVNKLNNNLNDLEVSSIIELLENEQYEFNSSNSLDNISFSKEFFSFFKDLKVKFNEVSFHYIKNKFIHFLRSQIAEHNNDLITKSNTDYIYENLIKRGFHLFFEIIELSTKDILPDNFKMSELYSKIKNSVSNILIIINDIYTSVSFDEYNRINNALNLKIVKECLTLEDYMNYFIIQHNLEIDKFNSYINEIKLNMIENEVKIIQLWIQNLKSAMVGFYYWKIEIEMNYSKLNEITNLVLSDNSSNRIEPL